MKLLKEFTSLSDAESLAERLRNKGVLAHVSSKGSKQLGSPVTGAVKVGVWVVLNEQFKDATGLLTNKKHHVEHQLSEEEMKNLESMATEQMKGSINKILNKLAIALASIIVMVIMFNVLSNA